MADETAAGSSGDPPSDSAKQPSDPATGFWSGTPASTPASMPQQLGRYRIKSRLGGGGMGAVYLVENTELQRDEALKVPHFEAGHDPVMHERFLREARAAAKLDHPNLCPIYDAGVINGVYYLTMRLLPGKPLSEYAKRSYAPREAVKLVLKLARALEYAHGKGVVHRDLKPSNVMMCPITGPTVMDFGLAKQKQKDNKLTQTGTTLGTPAYMPPEQVNGELDQIGPASDVYSLGVILFELVTGRLPFIGSQAEILARILFAKAPLPSKVRRGLSPLLDAVCGKAMAKKPQERYASMMEFAAALQEVLRKLPAKQEAGTPAAPAAGKHAGELFDEHLATPPAAPAPQGTPPSSKTTPQAMAQTPKPSKPGRRQNADAQPAPSKPMPQATPAPAPKASEQQDEDEQPAAPGRRPMVIGLSLALLLVGGVLTVLFSLSGGNSQGTKTTQGGSTNPVEDKKPLVDAGIGPGKLDKDKGSPAGIARTQEKGSKGPADAFANGFEMGLVRIPEGKFKMGSPENEKSREYLDKGNEKQHEVEVSTFHLGVHEVTQKQFRAVMGYNPSYFSKNATSVQGAIYSTAPGGGKDKIPAGDEPDNYPVENVSWEEANEFCEKLTAIDTKKPAGYFYRLPREAEWEYACRGGSPSYQVFNVGNSLSSREANFDGRQPYGEAGSGEYLERTSKVGSYAKNRFGVYDMHGNVWEWCLDRYGADYYGRSPAKDPPGPLEGSSRIIRGGSWNHGGQNCRSANRNRVSPGFRSNYLGFRVALVPVGR